MNPPCLSASRAALVLAGLLAGSPLAAAPSYMIGFLNQPDVVSATPFARDSTYALPPSNGDGLTTVHATALAGRVGATQHMEMNWTGGSGAFTSGSHARCRTDDFVISGPASPTSIPGTLHLRLRSSHALSGGYDGHGGHGSAVAVQVLAAQAFYPFGSYAQAFGNYQFTNAGPFSSGVLTGLAGPTVDFAFTLSANFPVNVPFAVDLRVEASGSGYGNFATNPGSVDSDAGGSGPGPADTGLSLEAVNGQVMTLPEGYTLDAPSWGIVNNLVGVDDVPAPARLRLASAGANPFRREARVALDLPRAGHARVTVFSVAGRLQRTLVDDRLPAGRRDLVWDGRNSAGASVPPGLYFVRAECAGERAITRLVRAR